MFQFTHPGKGATHRLHRPDRLGRFQFTHPGKGATNNPPEFYKTIKVSIHAPWEGCDTKRHSAALVIVRFNSRTLGRVRQIGVMGVIESLQFQFTHPGKGATPLRYVSRCRRLVSIHAPWEGCDTPRYAWLWLPLCFNSRTLGRVRLILSVCSVLVMLFQFTHPGKGATSTRSLRAMFAIVSIHAPWEGCDSL